MYCHDAAKNANPSHLPSFLGIVLLLSNSSSRAVSGTRAIPFVLPWLRRTFSVILRTVDLISYWSHCEHWHEWETGIFSLRHTKTSNIGLIFAALCTVADLTSVVQWLSDLMDYNRLQELAGKQACEPRCHTSQGQLKLGGFDDDSEWSDDPPSDDSALIISVKPHNTTLTIWTVGSTLNGEHTRQ